MRYLATVSYDGSKYNGYQKQPDGNTIQNQLENCLERLSSSPVSVVASGRTDRGVHAIGQRIHFDLDMNITCDKLKMAMNSMLSDSIYIRDIQEVPNDFHARYNVKCKKYIYKINTSEYNPIMKDYIYQYNKHLDIDLLSRALKLFIGEHDFKSFTSADDIRDNYVRTIMSASIVSLDDIVSIELVGTGFLRYMVRNIVGTLIDINEGKIDISDIENIFVSRDRTKAGKTAPAQGLYLEEVFYE